MRVRVFVYVCASACVYTMHACVHACVCVFVDISFIVGSNSERDSNSINLGAFRIAQPVERCRLENCEL